MHEWDKDWTVIYLKKQRVTEDRQFYGRHLSQPAGKVSGSGKNQGKH